MSQMNGTSDLRVPSPEQLAQATRVMQEINPVVKAAIHTVIRGILVSYPNVQPHAVLSMIAFETANFSAMALQGDLAVMMQIRNAMKSAYEEGIRKAPLIPPGSNWSPPEGSA